MPETKFHIQKYDGLEDIEKPSRALEVTLGSSTDTNLGHNHRKIYKNILIIVEIWVFSNRIFSGSTMVVRP